MTTLAGDGRATTQTMLQGAVEPPPLERMTVHQPNRAVKPCPLSYLLAHTHLAPSPTPKPFSPIPPVNGLLTNETSRDARSMLPTGGYCCLGRTRFGSHILVHRSKRRLQTQSCRTRARQMARWGLPTTSTPLCVFGCVLQVALSVALLQAS